MDSGSSRRPPSLLPDTRPLDWAGFLLVALFAIWSLLALLPLQLLNPVWGHLLVAVADRKDDAPAADQAVMTNVAVVTPFSGGGGLIQTTSG